MKNTTVSRRCTSGIPTHRLQMLAFTLRLSSIPVHAANLDQAGSRKGLQEVPVRQGFFQISSRQPGMLAPQAFRPRSLPVFDGIDERAVLLFGDGEDLFRTGQSFGQEHA